MTSTRPVIPVSPGPDRPVTTTAEIPPRWRRIGRLGDDGLTRLERNWYARRFRRTYGRDADHTKALFAALEASPCQVTLPPLHSLTATASSIRRAPCASAAR